LIDELAAGAGDPLPETAWAKMVGDQASRFGGTDRGEEAMGASRRAEFDQRGAVAHADAPDAFDMDFGAGFQGGFA